MTAADHSLRRVALAVGVFCFVIALPGVWARSTYGAQVSVDEPQYLLTAISLGEDFDLDISDEIADEAFRPFHEIDLNPQTTPVDEAGRRFSPHDPLLPAILAPATTMGGFVAARFALAFIGALTAAATAVVCTRSFGVRAGVSALTVAAFFAAPPLANYSTQIYPEMCAALMTVLGFGAIVGRVDRTGEPPSRNELLVAGAAVIALPWLAVKYVPIAAALAIAALWHARPVRVRALGFGLTLVVAGVIYLVAHQRIYGGWTVYSAGDHFAETGEFSVVGVDPNYPARTERLINLLVDQRFGLVPWNPAWLLAVFAMSRLVRGSRRFTTLGFPMFAAGYLTATFIALTMHGWWSPGRQLVAVLPIAVISVATWADESTLARRLVAVGGVAGVVNWLWLTTEANTGRRTIVVDFFDTAALPYRAVAPLFPDVVRDEGAWILQLVWLAVVVGLIAAGVAGASRSTVGRSDAVS